MVHGQETVDPETGELDTELATLDGWHIESDDALSWWLQRMGDLRAMAKRQREVAQAAEARADALQNTADRLLDLYKGEAEPYVRSTLMGGHKSRILPGGQVGFRQTQGSIEIPQESVGDVIRWCHEHLQAAVRPHYELLLTPLKDALQAGEELPPGIIWREPEDKLWVK